MAEFNSYRQDTALGSKKLATVLLYALAVSGCGRDDRLDPTERGASAVKPLMLLLLICTLLGISGCGRDPALAPPVGGEVVTVTVKVPKELEAEVMQVMYRSTVCTFTGYTASGKGYQREGYQSTEIQPVQQGQSDLYEARLAVDGGGDCKWRLSNVTFGVRYAATAQFGDDIHRGAGGGVVVIFDNNNSPYGPAEIRVDGDVSIVEDYYPWLKKNFLSGRYSKYISLVGDGSPHAVYQALVARYVYFEPVLHHEYLVRSIQPREKREGNHTAFTYPDGSVGAIGQTRPDFQKLQTIRQNAEPQL